MSANWPLHRLSDFISIKHGFAFKGEYFVDQETSDCLVTPGNFAIGGGFKVDKLKYYNGPVPEDYVLQPFDLIVTMTDLSKQADTLGYAALVPSLPGTRLLHNQRVGLVQCHGKGLDTTYLYFLLRSREYRHHVVSSATGSTVKHTSPTKITSYEFRLPPLHIQQEAGRTLLDIENKISTNSAINQTLEQMAQAIFKSWFVDFEPVKAKIAALEAGGSEEDALLAAMQVISGKPEATLHEMSQQDPEAFSQLAQTARLFPSAMQDSELGEIPEGWEISSIYEICEVIYGAPFKSKLFNQNREGIPLIRIRDLKNERPGVSTPEQHPKGYLVENGDLLVGMDGEFKPYIWGSGPAWMNQRVCCFKPRSGYAEGLVKGFIEPQLRERELTATATTVIHLGKGDIDRFSFINAGDDLLHKFSGIADSLYKKIVSNKASNHSLEQLRDTLLPKLLSGELSVADIESDINESREAVDV